MSIGVFGAERRRLTPTTLRGNFPRRAAENIPARRRFPAAAPKGAERCYGVQTVLNVTIRR